MIDDGYRQHLEHVDIPRLDAVSECRQRMPSANAVSVVSQIGLMVGSYHSVEQPVAFHDSGRREKICLTGCGRVIG
jgi:hypothetical protein